MANDFDEAWLDDDQDWEEEEPESSGSPDEARPKKPANNDTDKAEPDNRDE